MFFALAVFSGHGLRNLQNSFHILISFSFFRACSYAFLSLVNLVVSAILGAHFSYSSLGFFVVFYRAFLLSGSDLTSTP